MAGYPPLPSPLRILCPDRREETLTTANGLWVCKCGYPAGNTRAPEEDYCGICHAIRPGAGVTPPVTHRLTLPVLPPLANAFTGKRWPILHRLKFQFEQHVALAMREQRTPKATGLRRVALRAILGKGRKRPDKDAYDKICLDVLVRCGLLLDDSERGLVGRMEVEFERAPQDGSVILLEEMGPAPKRRVKARLGSCPTCGSELRTYGECPCCDK